MSIIHCASPAKLNLHLEVLGAHPTKKNYHALRSIMVKIDLYDYLHLEIIQNHQPNYKLIGLELPLDQDLLYKSYQLFLELSQLSFSLQITIDKKIPHFAGLGGSSANAATLLRHLNDHFHQPIDPTILIQCSQQLGADIPFFMQEAHAAIVEGIGEEISPIEPQSLSFVLVKSPEHIPTANAFGQLKKSLSTTNYHSLSKEQLTHLWQSHSPLTYAQFFTNDFITILPNYPQTHQTLQQLQQDLSLQWVSMSGSGNTLFAHCASEEVALALCKRYQAQGYYSRIIKTLI